MIERTEQEIIQGWKDDITVPLVSICTITYNHEKFIAEAIDSFLMQETDFPFEIVVDDDCSTDETAEVIRKYMEKFPTIIKANFRKNNIGMIMNFIENIKRVKGKYIALCEGDDYWTDSSKLQNQVDFLEKNKQVSMLFQNAIIKEYNIYEKIISSNKHTIGIEDGIVDPVEILSKKIVPTASVLFRNINLESFFDQIIFFPVGDTPLFLYLSKFGDIYYQNETTSVYRLLESGIVKSNFSSLEVSKSFVKYFKTLDDMFSELELSLTIKKLISIRYGYIIKQFFKEKNYKKSMIYILILFKHDPLYLLKYFNLFKRKKHD